MDKVLNGYSIGAAVLVGGRSTRMGSPKENMVIEGDGRTFLDKVCDEVDMCTGSCIGARFLSVRKGQETDREGYICVEDEYEDIGPLGGMIPVLKKAGEYGMDAVLFIACDMISYDKEEISSICGLYKGEDILWARTGENKIQPLASIYSVELVKYAVRLADKGEYKIRNIEQYAKCINHYDSKNEEKYINVNSL